MCICRPYSPVGATALSSEVGVCKVVLILGLVKDCFMSILCASSILAAPESYNILPPG